MTRAVSACACLWSDPCDAEKTYDKFLQISRQIRQKFPEESRRAIRATRARQDQFPSPRRRTARLSVDQVTALDKALAHSFHINLPPTRHLTIDWELGGVLNGVTATGRFLKLLKDGARRHGWKVAYLWVREHGDVHGDHVHILLHLPTEAYDWFKRRKPGWLKLCGARPGGGLSKTQPIVGAPRAIRPDEYLVEVQRYNVTAVLRYLAKHGDDRVSQTFGIVPHGDSWVTGKRVSVSQNLNTKARSTCVHCARLGECTQPQTI